ncbi:hypothetical protein P5673_022075 [Acropora cervicornis]|uniref:DUF4371 domain-containing protein n=1 Tax=Acropora cervicornis TaxID=6130 RepID=A0AAD9Q7B2_ACRCE|nr:hypothetical protein P5673_022075 [Acropora cervicornis]
MSRSTTSKNGSLSGSFQALLEFRIDSSDQTLQHHMETAPIQAIQNQMITTCYDGAGSMSGYLNRASSLIRVEHDKAIVFTA